MIYIGRPWKIVETAIHTVEVASSNLAPPKNAWFSNKELGVFLFP